MKGSLGAATYCPLVLFVDVPLSAHGTPVSVAVNLRRCIPLQAKNSEDCAAPLRLLERSVFSDRMVFVRAVHEAKWLSEMELSIYDSWCAPQPPSCIHLGLRIQGATLNSIIILFASIVVSCMRRAYASNKGCH